MGRLRPQFLTAHGFDRADVLIETGSQTGLSSERCAPLFSEIHTIELDRRLYLTSKKKLARFSHVHCHYGDSADILKKVINPYKSTVLWLDAHYVANYSHRSQAVRQCPLMEELRAVFSFAWDKAPAAPVILVDDARMFYRSFWRTADSRGYDRTQWPRIQAITRMAGRNGFGVERMGGVLVIESLKKT